MKCNLLGADCPLARTCEYAAGRRNGRTLSDMCAWALSCGDAMTCRGCEGGCKENWTCWKLERYGAGGLFAGTGKWRKAAPRKIFA